MGDYTNMYPRDEAEEEAHKGGGGALTEDDKKALVEYFGECWHITTVHHEIPILLTCSCGAEGWPYPCVNRTFTTWEDFGWLWEKCREKEWWSEFLESVQDGLETIWCIEIATQLVDKDRFPKLVYDFLKEKGEV